LLSDERTEYLIKDRLSFMRFLGLTLADRVPDANSNWNFREALSTALIDGVPAIKALFRRSDAALTKAGFLAMNGQIIGETSSRLPSSAIRRRRRRRSRKAASPRTGKPSQPN
jgi:transposase, IS5 family